jgi:uncharacterized integral membrane protein
MKRHPFDVTSLISGLVFVIVAAVYLVAAANHQYIDGRWLLPLALIGLGVAGVAGAIAAATRQRAASPPTPVDDDAPVDGDA